ncbi:unnamed protein product [Citrullus colocynthis]|uniref:Uncharacterized protein n=1 Tax=Citrullus colocynthis TaxID=252529 RepID=A0ABP0Z1Q8_9ROSI
MFLCCVLHLQGYQIQRLLSVNRYLKQIPVSNSSLSLLLMNTIKVGELSETSDPKEGHVNACTSVLTSWRFNFKPASFCMYSSLPRFLVPNFLR